MKLIHTSYILLTSIAFGFLFGVVTLILCDLWSKKSLHVLCQYWHFHCHVVICAISNLASLIVFSFPIINDLVGGSTLQKKSHPRRTNGINGISLRGHQGLRLLLQDSGGGKIPLILSFRDQWWHVNNIMMTQSAANPQKWEPL